MALFRCMGSGGGEDYDFSNPTVIQQGNIAANGDLTAFTPSRAKLVIATRVRYGADSGASVFYVWDEVNQKGVILSYNSGNYTHISLTSPDAGLVVGNSYVTLSGTSNTQRGHLAVWC